MIDTIIEAISSPRGVEGRERAVAVNETMPTRSIEVIARHLAAGVDAGGIGGSGARNVDGHERAVAVDETMETARFIAVITCHLAAVVDAAGIGRSGAGHIQDREAIRYGWGVSDRPGGKAEQDQHEPY